MKKRPLLVVEWEDITTRSGWIDAKEADFKLEKCYTVGWKFKSGKDYILLSSFVSSDDEVSQRHKIPKGCIKNIRKVE